MKGYQLIEDFDMLCEILHKMHDDWEVLQEDVSEAKHDCTHYSYLLKHKNGELYTIGVESSYNDGLDPYNTIEYPFTPDKAEIIGEYKQYTYRVKKES